MSRYSVTGFDVCVPGFERLRSEDEILLVAYIGKNSGISSLAEQWQDDIQAACRDNFDYDSARACVREFADSESSYIMRNVRAAQAEMPDSDDEAPEFEPGECAQAFLYIRDSQAGY